MSVDYAFYDLLSTKTTLIITPDVNSNTKFGNSRALSIA